MTGGGLHWSEETRAGATIVAPSGRIDESTASQFNDQLGEVAKRGGTLVLDLAGVDYMSSRGLRALTLAQRSASGAGTTIVLARPNETMREILAISRYDMIFRVTDSLEDALDR